MTLDVLLSAMYLDNYHYIDSLNITGNCVIINQCDRSQIQTIHEHSRQIQYIETTERGLSNSRNMALNHAAADIGILCDDDVVYLPDYQQRILNAFHDHPEADVIAFQVEGIEQPFKQYPAHSRKLGFLTSMKVCSVEIAFRISSVKASGIHFDTRFGAGAQYCSGEENIFLSDCLKHQLKLLYLPIKIADLHLEDSSWFQGYNESFFITKGAVFTRMNRSLSLLYILQFAIRKYKLYQEQMSFSHALSYMLKGRKQFLKEIYETLYSR